MRPAGLALERAPPIAVPLRFFLTAPLFLLAAGGVLMWSGPEALAWRGSPAALAATHFVTLGFMTMVMAGAMLQMLPVLAGTPVPHVGVVAALVHGGLALGAAALGVGFLLGQPLLLKIAAWLLGAGIAVLAAAAAAALTRAAVRNATTRGTSLGVAGLVVTVALGLVLIATYAWGVPLPNLAARALHPAWGLLGWAGLLVAGGGVPGGADVPDDAAIPGRDDALVHRRRVRRSDRVVAGDVVRERQPGRARPRPRARRRLRAVRGHDARTAAPAAPSRARRDDRVLAARDGLRARGVRRVGGAACRAERAACARDRDRRSGARGVRGVGDRRHAVQDRAVPRLVPPAGRRRRRSARRT